MSVVLLPIKNSVPLSDVEAVHPTATIAACDFYITGAEAGLDAPGGYQLGRVINIDHHAPTLRMSCMISSANLAIEWVRAGNRPGSIIVVVNHTDCDSVLSAAVVSGELPPDDDIGTAALAADHTGEANDIADMLQGLQHERDFALSVRNVKLLRANMPLEPIAQSALEQRRQTRQLAKEDVKRFRWIGQLAWAELDHDTDSEYYPALLPEAALIFIAVPHPSDASKKFIRVRLGRAAAAGFSMHELRLKEFDSAYGGRWNAGSNKRSGGTALAIPDYVAEVAKRLAACGAK